MGVSGLEVRLYVTPRAEATFSRYELENVASTRRITICPTQEPIELLSHGNFSARKRSFSRGKRPYPAGKRSDKCNSNLKYVCH